MKKKLTIPTSWNDVTIRQYQYYAASIDKAITTRQKAMVAVTAFCGLSEEEVPYLTQDSYEDIVSRLHWVNQAPESDADLIQLFEHEGVEYGFIPNWTKLTFGEFVDLEHFASEGRLVENLDRAMALMYRPVIEKVKGHYTISDYTIDEGRVAIMRDMPMTLAVGAMVFFWNIAEIFANGLRSSLPPSNNPKENGSLGINGVGTE